MAKRRREIAAIIRRYVVSLQARGATVEQVILYGSYAHGRAREHSDIDVAIISPFFHGRGIRERQEFLGLAFGDLYEPIEPRGYTPEEYAQAEAGTLLHEIKRTGVVIYQAHRARTPEKVS